MNSLTSNTEEMNQKNETEEEYNHRIAVMFYEECMDNAGITNYPQLDPLCENEYWLIYCGFFTLIG